jgi:hypothetical protein
LSAWDRGAATASRDFLASGPRERRDAATSALVAKNLGRARDRGVSWLPGGSEISGVESPKAEGGLSEQLGDEIAELSAHLEAATSRLLELIRAARTRTIPPALRRALHHRDRGCRFPGCGVRFGQGHHIRHWAQGGPTTLSNLAMLCRRHHRAVHEEGYQLDRSPDGALRFRRPNGQLLPEVPSPLEVPGDPVKILRAQHDALGLCLHTRTATPSWLGERLDVGWAIDVLHPLARPCMAVSNVGH